MFNVELESIIQLFECVQDILTCEISATFFTERDPFFSSSAQCMKCDHPLSTFLGFQWVSTNGFPPAFFFFSFLLRGWTLLT